MGEGISKGVEQELAKIEDPMNNQDNFKDQPVGTDEEDLEEENPTVHTMMASGWVSKPQHTSSKRLVKPHSLWLSKIIILLSVN